MYGYGQPTPVNYSAMIAQLQQMEQNQQNFYNQYQQRQAQAAPPQTPPATQQQQPSQQTSGIRSLVTQTLEQAKKLQVNEGETVIGIIADGSAIHVKKHSTETWTLEEDTYYVAPKEEKKAEPSTSTVDALAIEHLQEEIKEIKLLLQGVANHVKSLDNISSSGKDDSQRSVVSKSKDGRRKPWSTSGSSDQRED